MSQKLLNRLESRFPGNHPEKLDNELFLCNVDSKFVNFNVAWKTQRKGIQAFDIDDKPLQGYYPLFVNKQEVLNAPENVDWNG